MCAFGFNCTVEMRVGLPVLGVLKALYVSVRRSVVFRQQGELLNSESELNMIVMCLSTVLCSVYCVVVPELSDRFQSVYI